LHNNASSPKVLSSILSASGGTNSYGSYSYNGGTVTIENSQVTASTNTIYAGVTTRVGASRLSGGPVYNDFSMLTCTSSYDGNNRRLGSRCTPDTKVVYVATTGGDFTSIQAALTSIGDNSANNKYLIKVGPGTYTETVQMKQWVDIEGSGEKNTKITFTGSNPDNTGTVRGANNAELRSLTVENTGGVAFDFAIAIYNNNASPSLLHVTAAASGGSLRSVGVYNISSAAPTLTNVTSSATGSSDNRAVLNDGSSPRIVDSNLSSSGGNPNFGITSHAGGTVTIDQSKITGSSNTIFNDFGVTTRVGASQLSGGPVFNAVGGTLTCTGVYDENYVSPGLNVCP
jgi:hypothetical protein